ncbi:MAG: hypothetical protein QW228_08400 [Candidatus Aenigmatarchaeota archaeon]
MQEERGDMKNRVSLRSLILEFLYKVYPHYVLEMDILYVFYKDFRDVYIKKTLQYLIDKGYVEKLEKEIPRIGMKTFYKLTHRGVDLVEGLLKDDNIPFDDENQ